MDVDSKKAIWWTFTGPSSSWTSARALVSRLELCFPCQVHRQSGTWPGSSRAPTHTTVRPATSLTHMNDDDVPKHSITSNGVNDPNTSFPVPFPAARSVARLLRLKTDLPITANTRPSLQPGSCVFVNAAAVLATSHRPLRTEFTTLTQVNTAVVVVDFCQTLRGRPATRPGA